MTAVPLVQADKLSSGELGLTPAKLVVLVAFATLAWFLAATFIRTMGPSGAFQGLNGLMLYAITVPATLPLNWLSRRIVNLPKKRTLSVIAVTASSATLLDGITMSHIHGFGGVYGADPAVIAGGGAWLLWAIGVALALALITSSLGSERS